MKKTWLAVAIGVASACGGTDTGTPKDAGVSADADTAAQIERGRYLVNNVFACVDCHTPRNQDGTFDMSKQLSGVECLFDVMPPADNGMGCLHSRNLTPDETGLKNRTDAEIKNAFLNGVRASGAFLNSVMPYYFLHNMNDADADAIVAYLRSIPPVVHQIPAQEAPWDNVTAAATPISDAQIPAAGGTGATLESAKRGRYIAGIICIDCHTPDNPDNPPGGPNPKIFSKVFEGGADFGALLPHPPFPDHVYSQNITPDATGIAGMTVDQIVKELREGIDRDGQGICPPMPSGPMGAFGGMTPEDATDIANYLLNIPPRVSSFAQCELPTN